MTTTSSSSSASSSARCAIVIGVSGAIGSAIARRLVAQGLHVILHANSRVDAVRALADELNGAGLSAEPVAFDVTDRDATRAACDGLLAAGPVQVVVNNAGTHDDAAFPALRDEQWHRVIDVSVDGFFNVTQPLLLPMLRTRWGRIVSVSSVTAIVGNRGQVNYAAAKSALHGATKSLAREMASRGITANVVAPGVIAGRLADAAFDEAQVKAMIPAARIGTPEEVAAVVAFLCSDRAAYVNGQVIGVNGGMV